MSTAVSTGATPALIGLDWGTTSLRAFLMDASGAVLQEQRRPWGIMQLPPAPTAPAPAPSGSEAAYAGFERAFDDICAEWLAQYANLPVIACGMVGSAQGWKEAAYLDAPASLDQLARQLTRVERTAGGALYIVPGLIQRATLPDVMRGEETQVLGVLADTPQAGVQGAPLLIGLPGTHSKWVSASAAGGTGVITQFTSYMTGEVFAALRQHTILGRTMQPAARPDDAAFVRGLQVALADGAKAWLSHIFSTRTLGLTGQLPGSAQADYLSGLLIGYEVADLLQRYGSAQPSVVLCGEPDLCRRYTLALQTAGFATPQWALQSTARGLWQIARAAGLMAASAH